MARDTHLIVFFKLLQGNKIRISANPDSSGDVKIYTQYVIYLTCATNKMRCFLYELFVDILLGFVYIKASQS